MLIFNFLLYIYIFFCVITIVLTVLSMHFIGDSGLRDLPLSINDDYYTFYTFSRFSVVVTCWTRSR